MYGDKFVSRHYFIRIWLAVEGHVVLLLIISGIMDSLFVDKPIPEEIVSKNKLGYYKLESKISEGVFLASKAYAYKSGGEEITKLKGV